MYMSKLVEVGKAENGYVISCCVPLKKESKPSKDGCCCESSIDRQYVCKDAAEVAKTISDLMPLLDEDYSTEDDFDEAFEEAIGTMDDEKGED